MEMEQINPDENKKFIPIKTLVIYSLIFYLFWAVFNFFAKPFLAENMSDVWAAFIEDGIVKNLAWTLPAVLLLKKYSGSFFVELPKLYKPNKECIKYLWVYPAAMLVLLLKPAINGGIKIADSFGLGYIIIVLFVGITEETVFRGFLLNSTYERHNEVSIAVNAVMFQRDTNLLSLPSPFVSARENEIALQTLQNAKDRTACFLQDCCQICYCILNAEDKAALIGPYRSGKHP